MRRRLEQKHNARALEDLGRWCIPAHRIHCYRLGGSVAARYMNEEPIRRFTLLVLFQAQQDHATELTIGLASSGRPAIRYKVGGTWYDMSPPPAHIMPGVVAELERLADFANQPYAKQGLIDVACGGSRLRLLTPVAQ